MVEDLLREVGYMSMRIDSDPIKLAQEVLERYKAAECQYSGYVIDRNEIIWALAHDGGMVTRADDTGQVSAGIEWLRQHAGPLSYVDVTALAAAPILAAALIEAEKWNKHFSQLLDESNAECSELHDALKEAQTELRKVKSQLWDSNCYSETADTEIFRSHHELAEAQKRIAELEAQLDAGNVPHENRQY